MRRDLGAIEAVKWAAFVAMLLDHLDLILFGRSVPWMHAVGAFAAPAFALCFGMGLPLSTSPARTASRLLLPAAAAQALWIAAGHVVGLNILFTFVLCATVVAVPSFWRLPVACAALFASLDFEGGPLLLCVVLAGYLVTLHGRRRWALVALPWLAGTPALGALLGLVGPLVALRVPALVRRWPGALALLYPLHLAALVAASLAARSAA